MTTTYSAAPEAARIAKELIGKHHTRLADIRVEFVFREKAAKSRGRVVLAKARKVTGLGAFMARPITSNIEDLEGDEFFVIELAEDQWQEMSPKKRKALVDQELCHLGVEYNEDKEEWYLSLRSPDVSTFTEIIERHGLWEDELVKFAEAAKTQLDLFGQDGGE